MPAFFAMLVSAVSSGAAMVIASPSSSLPAAELLMRTMTEPMRRAMPSSASVPHMSTLITGLNTDEMASPSPLPMESPRSLTADASCTEDDPLGSPVVTGAAPDMNCLYLPDVYVPHALRPCDLTFFTACAAFTLGSRMLATGWL